MQPKSREKIVWIARTKNIRQAKGAFGIPVRKMAEDLGLNAWRLQHILGGQQFCPPSIANKVAEYFGQKATDLFFCIDLENPDEFLKATAA